MRRSNIQSLLLLHTLSLRESLIKGKSGAGVSPVLPMQQALQCDANTGSAMAVSAALRAAKQASLQPVVCSEAFHFGIATPSLAGI